MIRNAIDSTTDQSTSKEQFNQVANAVAEESSSIKNTFVLKVLSLEQSQADRFVLYHQQVLINLLNELAKAPLLINDKQPSKKESVVNEFVRFSTHELEDILGFIQNHFPNYFDMDASVPEMIKKRALQAVKESAILLENNLSKFEVDPALLSICLVAMSDFLKEHDTNMSYRKVKCIKELITELLQLSQAVQEGASLNSEIQSCLFHLNYNRSVYFKYRIHILTQELLVSETLSGKLEVLAYHHKVINQSIVKSGFTFETSSPSLKEQLSVWILEEIQFLERKQQLSAAFPGPPEDQVRKDFKLIFDMSVSQFAYLIKTLIETGVIQNKNISELIRFLSKFVKTKRSESISHESFRIKYYNPEENTKGAIRNLFHTAIGYINSN